MRVLLLYPDAAGGGTMAGLAIRAYELARALGRRHDVTLGLLDGGAVTLDGVRTVDFHPHDPRTVAAEIDAADAIVCPPLWPLAMRRLRRSGARLVFDLYDPETLETLELFAGAQPRVRGLMTALTVDRLAEALRIGDHFLCATERQRDLWIGAMLALGVLDPARYDGDPTLRRTIALVPFGVPGEAAVPRGTGVRGRFGDLGADAEIVLWSGGIWPWFDAPGAIRAVAALSERRPNVRLVFMGTSSRAGAARAAEEARAVAAELGVLDTVVRFNDTWVPYEERTSWLADAACAVSTHVDHLETRYSFRTRLLDCLWTRTPVVCTGGDELGELVRRRDLGATVPGGDPAALAAALERVLDRGRDAYGPALAETAAAYAWPRVVAPLDELLAGPSPRVGRAPAPAPARAARAAVYGAAKRTLNAVGLRDWPRVGA